MFIIYDLIFLVISLIYLPIYLFKGKFHRGFLARLGMLPLDLKLDKPIWVHAVSVGEAMAVRGLVDGLRRLCPDKKFVISTVTLTGNKIAKGIAKDGDFVTYLPLDLSFIVGCVINRIKPSLFIIAETELWPNLICALDKKNIPIIIVNGRISDASFRGYQMIKFLLKPTLKKVSLFCVQTERDKERLICLGVSDSKIEVTGNVKFDNLAEGKDYADYRGKINLQANQKLLVAGSTHPGEEEEILNVYRGLLKEFPKLKLLIAPRHPERAKDIAKKISKFGFTPVFISNPDTNPSAVFILDSVGQLLSYYAISDFVFIGGSLVRKGGHNILEPAFFGKPIIFGPYMFNFRDIAELFLGNKAAIEVRNEEELRLELEELLRSPNRALTLGNNARKLVEQNTGATKKNTAHIKKYCL